MLKKTIQKVIKFGILYAMLIAVFVAVLMVGQAIPRSLVVNNVEKSYETLKDRGVSFKVTDGASWDNWTDSYFLNAAVTEYPGNLLEKAIANAHTTIGETGENKSYTVIDNIKYAVDANEDIIIKPYSRYWAGMMTIYKILLIFMPINGIRTLVFDIAMILFALSIINIYRLLGLKGVLPYLLSIIISLYIPQSLCLVFSTDIVIMFLMMNICCIMLKKGTSTNALYAAFFLAGSVLAYLNYWAFPLITLGFPLIFIVTAKLREHYDIRALTKETIIISFSWGAGLGGTVLVKQILCKTVLGTQTGTNQLLLRMGSELSIKERFISLINGLFERMESLPVLLIIIITTIWTTILFQTNCFKRKYKCFLLILIAFYPIVWWFILANHCVHGFVKHIYGVTYYALLSVILMNCEIPSFTELVRVLKKSPGIYIFAAGILVFLSYSFINTVVHYGISVSEPWSTEITGNVYPREETITQNVQFDDLNVGTAYLKNISTILGNIPDDKKEGILHVEISENNNILAAANVSIAEIEVGNWFQIPLGCIIHSGQEYQIAYCVENANESQPCLFIQDDSQAVRENGTLYVDNIEKNGAVVNKYEYDDYIICTKTKISLILIALILLQYMVFVLKEKNSQATDNRIGI